MRVHYNEFYPEQIKYWMDELYDVGVEAMTVDEFRQYQ